MYQTLPWWCQLLALLSKILVYHSLQGYSSLIGTYLNVFAGLVRRKRPQRDGHPGWTSPERPLSRLCSGEKKLAQVTTFLLENINILIFDLTARVTFAHM